jgi:hypothetical protein
VRGRRGRRIAGNLRVGDGERDARVHLRRVTQPRPWCWRRSTTTAPSRST